MITQERAVTSPIWYEPSTIMKRILREPLLHFLLLGAALFALYGWLNRAGFNAPDEIVVSRGEVGNLQAQFARVWQRDPTPQELKGLIDGWVREEIYYREALAMGLDRDDPVVRRRMGQKVQFILDGATPPAPTAEELQRWFEEHAADYRIEPIYSLRQVYFDPARHGADLDRTIAGALRALERGKTIAGDSTMLPATANGDTQEIARTFGSEFEEAMRTLPVGSWQGPVRSGFGLHLVELTAREEAHMPTLEEVRAVVERDLMRARAAAASDAYYERLRGSYTVRIEGGDGAATDPAS